MRYSTFVRSKAPSSLMSNTQARLSYPLKGKTPDFGQVTNVAPGVHWLRMPLPFSLDHINLWLLEDEGGWVIVDTGIASQRTKSLWQEIFDTHLNGKPVTRILVTHMHPDHIGLAGWLAERWDVELWMTRTDYLLCRNLAADTGRAAPEAGVQFYRAAGFDEQSLVVYRRRFGEFGALISHLPDAFRRLQDGDNIQVGKYAWQVVIGRGHAPEHACLYCPTLNVFISGDQILPHISSNVSVWPTEPHANPLLEWLESCASLQEQLPPDVLVLPSHGNPFAGAHLRLQQLIGLHEKSLDALHTFCKTPRRAIDVFSALFRSKIDAGNLIMATGESIAHLNYLIAEGRLAKTTSDDGVHLYKAVGRRRERDRSI